MFTGIINVFLGKDALARNISFFSVCGIIGLVNAYLIYADDKIKVICTIILALFSLFLVGFETIFLHEKELPDIDMRAFKVVLNNRVPFIIFIVSLIFLITGLYLKHSFLLMFVESIVAVPMTVLLADFAVDYKENSLNHAFKYFNVKDYFVLFLKRLLFISLAFLFAIFVMFILLLIFAITIVIFFKGDLNAIGMFISSQSGAAAKLQVYILAVLLTYFGNCSSLIWDIELLETKERNCYGNS